MVAANFTSLKRTNTITLTVANGATESDWVRMPSSVIKVLHFKTPSNTPNTTCVFDVRTIDATGTIYPVATSADIASLLTVQVNGLGAFGSNAILPLTSYCDGFHEVRITLGTAITGSGSFILGVPSMSTE